MPKIQQNRRLSLIKVKDNMIVNAAAPVIMSVYLKKSHGIPALRIMREINCTTPLFPIICQNVLDEEGYLLIKLKTSLKSDKIRFWNALLSEGVYIKDKTGKFRFNSELWNNK